MNRRTPEEYAERYRVHRQLAKNHQCIVRTGARIADNSKRGPSHHPQQKEKQRPALLARKISCDKNDRSHDTVPDSPPTTSLGPGVVNSRNNSSSDLRTGLMLTTSPPSDQTRSIASRCRPIGTVNLSPSPSTIEPANRVFEVECATIST